METGKNYQHHCCDSKAQVNFSFFLASLATLITIALPQEFYEFASSKRLQFLDRDDFQDKSS